MDASDGGHDSTHIMLKVGHALPPNLSFAEDRQIPYYLDSEKVTSACFPSLKLMYAVKVNHLSTVARRLNPSDATTRTSRSFPSGISGNPSTSHIDISASLGSNHLDQRDHQFLCGHCRQVCIGLYFFFPCNPTTLQSIVGIRYQCANCPSSPIGYNLVRINLFQLLRHTN